MAKKIFISIISLLAMMWLLGEFLLYRDRIELSEVDATESVSTSSVVEKARDIDTPHAVRIGEAELPATLNPKTVEVILPKPSTTTLPLPALSESESRDTINVTLTVDGKSYPYTIAEGGSVADLLTQAEKKGEISVVKKDYSGLGVLITEINGKQNNINQNNMYWIYSVNGKKATVGVTQYILHEGDNIFWSYEPSTY